MSAKCCESCNSTQMFLREKGPNIGLYCAFCEKWQKWVGKKEIPTYKRNGYRVHGVDYVPDTLGVLLDEPPQGGQSVHTHNAPPTYVPPINNNGYDFGVDESSAVAVAVEPENTWSDDCRTCLTGSLDMISSSANMIINIAEGMMLITDRSQSKLFGSVSISHCPSCGRKL